MFFESLATYSKQMIVRILTTISILVDIHKPITIHIIKYFASIIIINIKKTIK